MALVLRRLLLTQEGECGSKGFVCGSQEGEHGGWRRQLLVQAGDGCGLQHAVGIVGLEHVCHRLAAVAAPTAHLAVSCKYDTPCLTARSTEAGNWKITSDVLFASGQTQDSMCEHCGKKLLKSLPAD